MLCTGRWLYQFVDTLCDCDVKSNYANYVGLGAWLNSVPGKTSPWLKYVSHWEGGRVNVSLIDWCYVPNSVTFYAAPVGGAKHRFWCLESF